MAAPPEKKMMTQSENTKKMDIALMQESMAHMDGRIDFSYSPRMMPYLRFVPLKPRLFLDPEGYYELDLETMWERIVGAAIRIAGIRYSRDIMVASDEDYVRRFVLETGAGSFTGKYKNGAFLTATCRKPCLILMTYPTIKRPSVD